MPRIKHYLNNNWLFYLTAFGLSILFSLLMYTYQQPFNIDGILYLHTAKEFQQHGLHAAMQVYDWPFYPILLALVSQLCSFSVLQASYLLNTLLDATTVIAFLLLVKSCGATRGQQALALLLILMLPSFTHLHNEIVRGHGYYPCFILALLCLIGFFRQARLSMALAWGILASLAALFRVEGVVLLALTPLIYLAKPNLSIATKCKNTLLLYCVPLLLLLALILYAMLHKGLDHYHFGRLYQVAAVVQTASHIWHNLIAQATKIAPAFLSQGRYQVFHILLFGLLGLFVYIVIKSVTLLYSILFVYGVQRRVLTAADWNAKAILYWTILLNLLIVLLFTLKNYFIPSRYLMLLSLLTLTLIPFVLTDLYQCLWKKAAKNSKKRYLFSLIVLSLLYMFISAIGHFGTSKTYLITAGNWLKTNTPQQSLLYTNSPLVFYYADRPGGKYPKDFHDGQRNFARTLKMNLKHYNFVAIKISHHHLHERQQIIEHLQQQPIHVFHNPRGDELLIFK